jgi:hypothetical protein
MDPAVKQWSSETKRSEARKKSIDQSNQRNESENGMLSRIIMIGIVPNKTAIVIK